MPFDDHWAIKFTVILVVVFILQMMFPVVTDLFVLDASELLERPWGIITAIFLHASLEHILFNGFALVLFGSILESIIGSRKFVLYFFITGIIAGVIFILGIPIIQSVQGATPTSALGASGAIFGILGILTVLRPNLVVYLAFIPMPMWVAAIMWAFLDFFGIFIPSNVANFAHLGGLFSGLLIGFYLNDWKINIGNKKSDPNVLSESEISKWEKEWMQP
ncbi:MAG TPA: rhomboid family intramembrane serine protease [archaeon]|nr:rhomboid family intramembrane serine protease [archaeon]